MNIVLAHWSVSKVDIRAISEPEAMYLYVEIHYHSVVDKCRAFM
jgi:hypothetical protein